MQNLNSSFTVVINPDDRTSMSLNDHLIRLKKGGKLGQHYENSDKLKLFIVHETGYNSVGGSNQICDNVFQNQFTNQ